MAKMYYNSDETLAKLNCNEDQLRTLVRAGKLREFRDAGKLNYKVEDVDRLVAEQSSLTGSSQAGGSSSGDLGLSDSGEISLLPDDSGSAAGLKLDDSSTKPAKKTDQGGSGSDSPVDLSASTGELKLEESGEISLSDTGTAELKLEDSGTVAPPAAPAKPTKPSKPSKPSSKDAMSLDEVDKDSLDGMKKDDTVITNIGISVFDEDDLEISADPLAKTMLTSGGEDHLGLDGSAGGSGLLDLTRESDDTSLGAELLEGIDMGDTGESKSPVAAQEDESLPPEPADDVMPESALEPMLTMGPRTVAVQYVETAPPVFTGLLVAAAMALTILGATVMATTMNAWPSYLAIMSDNFWITLGGMLALGGIAAGIGYAMGMKPSGPRPTKKPKEAKAKKEQKVKPAKGKKGEATPGIPD